MQSGENQFITRHLNFSITIEIDGKKLISLCLSVMLTSDHNVISTGAQYWVSLKYWTRWKIACRLHATQWYNDK